MFLRKLLKTPKVAENVLGTIRENLVVPRLGRISGPGGDGDKNFKAKNLGERVTPRFSKA